MKALRIEQDLVRVVVVDSPELLDSVCRFRYQVYVELMKRQQKHANHQLCTIVEPLDEAGINFAIFVDDRIVGTVRGNRFSDPSSSYYYKIYKIDKFSNCEPHEIQFTTKLMVLPEYRRTAIPVILIREYGKVMYRRGAKLNFIDCNKPLIPLFERMGYFSYTGWVFHKEFGSVRPMFLPTDTLRYQRDIKSIIYEPANAIVTDNQYGGYETVQRYAKRPTCDATAKVAEKYFNFSSGAK